MKEIRINRNEAEQRADKFLRRYLPEAGSGFLYKQMRKKNIVLNGKKMDGKELLQEGDRIRIFFSDETLAKFAGRQTAENDRTETENAEQSKQASDPVKKLAEQISSMIIYEDADAAILNKPAGVLSQASGKGEISLVEGFRQYLCDKGELTEESLRLYAPSVVNRLDRNTSGIILAAKTLPAARELSEKLRERTISKYYLAAAEGQIRDAQDCCAWLLKDTQTNKVHLYSEPVEGASPVHTAWKPLRYTELMGSSCTLLEVDLITGKTHQIRSHLAFHGHPILGDVKYGSKTLNEQLRSRYGLRRQFLHAYRVEFPDMQRLKQLSGKTFTADVPKDLKKIHLRF
ncbi:MAG: RluA family pseudouridine synthase [Eubacteriales bacterium]|nr:RluA family pseudouridine synthase [Eubacteriales bacterium]